MNRKLSCDLLFVLVLLFNFFSAESLAGSIRLPDVTASPNEIISDLGVLDTDTSYVFRLFSAEYRTTDTLKSDCGCIVSSGITQEPTAPGPFFEVTVRTSFLTGKKTNSVWLDGDERMIARLKYNVLRPVDFDKSSYAVFLERGDFVVDVKLKSRREMHTTFSLSTHPQFSSFIRPVTVSFNGSETSSTIEGRAPNMKQGERIFIPLHLVDSNTTLAISQIVLSK